MKHFLAFLSESAELRACSLRVIKTRTNGNLRPLSDYVTIAVQAPGAGHRRYKYAEACWNLALTEKGQLLPLDVQLLQIERSCSKGCGAVTWYEIVTPQDLRDRTVQICFRSYSITHTIACVPVGTVARPKECPLLGSRVAVKELGRQVDVRPSQIEVGNVKVSSVAHDPEILPMLLSQSKALPIGKIAPTLKTSRGVRREKGDFPAVHDMLTAAAVAAEDNGQLQSFQILQYHPAVDIGEGCVIIAPRFLIYTKNL
jgi:hypothetical protein